jgi:hypothetical protein
MIGSEVKTENQCFNLMTNRRHMLIWKFYENIAALVSSFSKYHQMKFHHSLEEIHTCIRGWGYVVQNRKICTFAFLSEKGRNYFIIYNIFIECTGFKYVQAVKIYSTTNWEEKMLLSSSVNRYILGIIKLL